MFNPQRRFPPSADIQPLSREIRVGDAGALALLPTPSWDEDRSVPKNATHACCDVVGASAGSDSRKTATLLLLYKKKGEG